jgi:hypothetical protein
VTGAYPVPTWGDIDAFCAADEWTADRKTDHVFWEKVLPSGEILSTHRSFGTSQEIGPDLFRRILREQLKVSRDDFWAAIRTRKPVDRPVELDVDTAPVYPGWVIAGLTQRGLTPEEIRKLSPDEARRKLEELWSSPRP